MERERKKTFKLVRNIMNIKKMFKGRHRSRKKDKYDPDQVVVIKSLLLPILNAKFQPSYLLMLIVEPSLFETVFTFLDHRAISALELTCTVLRDVVIETKIFRRRFTAVTGSQHSQPEPGDLAYDELVQQSRHYKCKLYEHFSRYLKIFSQSEKNLKRQFTSLRRKRNDALRVHRILGPGDSWHSPDCASCMMIETGEKTSQPGLRCDSCGRFPRSIGGY